MSIAGRVRRISWQGAAVLLFVVHSAGWAAEPVGSVAALEGHADVLHPGAADRVALAAGDAVLLGDRLRTHADAKLKLAFRDESVLTLAASSELAVTEQVAGAAAPVSRFSLLVGTLRAVVTERYGQPGARFEVETPTAIAGVRGTGFLATYDAAADETVVVGLFDTTRVRALADARGTGHEVLLGPGDVTRVPRGALPVRPTRMPENTLRGLDAATTVLPALGPGGRRSEGTPKATGSAAIPQQKARPQDNVDQPVDLLKGGPARRTPPPPPPPPHGK